MRVTHTPRRTARILPAAPGTRHGESWGTIPAPAGERAACRAKKVSKSDVLHLTRLGVHAPNGRTARASPSGTRPRLPMVNGGRSGLSADPRGGITIYDWTATGPKFAGRGCHTRVGRLVYLTQVEPR
ncbi:hypothetical protein GCM10023335_51960 [Streptomyces siamensis]|uniref:Uncharacterized protein n=1 Tax=Streptomyces siamensis TaxID=1274986 RepID=A0ABP9J7E0_9ACTN